MQQVLEIFLAERKSQWILKKTKGKEVKPEKLEALKKEADEKYETNAWIAKAIKQARPSVTTHPSTFTHSDAKTTALHFVGKNSLDGLLKSGNVSLKQKFDVFGNAATDSVVWDTYLFLNENFDGKTILEHFKENSDASKQFIINLKLDYEYARSQFIGMFESSNSLSTSRLLKQVYFPISNDYHLLSLLSSSVLMAELKRRIHQFRFSDMAREVKEKFKKKEYSQDEFCDFLNLTVMGFGGSKPQNVSALNSQNYGEFYLLPCLPPTFERRKVRLPSSDFFSNTLRLKYFKEGFQILYDLAPAKNNVDTRQAVKETLQVLITQVLTVAFKVREIGGLGWTSRKHYQNLPAEQKIWLDNVYEQQRQDNEDWIKSIANTFSRWFLNTYEAIAKKQTRMLGDGELAHVRKLITQALTDDKEFLK